MKRKFFQKLLLLSLLLFVLVACKPVKEKTPERTPFLGGTTGLSIEFVDFRSEVFDGGGDFFDVTVRLQNKGEWTVSKDKVRVKLFGINPSEFGVLEEQLVGRPTEDLPERKRDLSGSIIESLPVTVEFKNLNYKSRLAGASLTFPLAASVCYNYGTKAESLLCVRKNILNPEAGGLCEINEAKTVFNSGAPIQIENLRETARTSDKIGFSFDIVKKGEGKVFASGSNCLEENKVSVTVDAGLGEISCTGLTTSGTVASGTVTLFDGKKSISCTQQVKPADFEQRLTITASYDFEGVKQTSLTVKRSG
ncbi:MAG: hypothetical protein QW559_01780 [Candidatus Woesearchaeota archaeon]